MSTLSEPELSPDAAVCYTHVEAAATVEPDEGTWDRVKRWGTTAVHLVTQHLTDPGLTNHTGGQHVHDWDVTASPQPFPSSWAEAGRLARSQ